MTVLKCEIEGGRMITIESLNKLVRNGNTFDVTDEELCSSDIQFLLSKQFLVVESADNDTVVFNKNIYNVGKKLFFCSLDEGKKISLDSIKGTAVGQTFIEIKTGDLRNNDVDYAIRNGMLEEREFSDDKRPKVDNKDDTKPVKLKRNLDKVFDNSEKTSDDNRALEQIDLDNLNTIESKSKQPDFRVNSEVSKDLKSLGDDLYGHFQKEDAEPKPPPRKRGRPRKADTEKGSAKKKTTVKSTAKKKTTIKSTAKKAKKTSSKSSEIKNLAKQLYADNL